MRSGTQGEDGEQAGEGGGGHRFRGGLPSLGVFLPAVFYLPFPSHLRNMLSSVMIVISGEKDSLCARGECVRLFILRYDVAACCKWGFDKKRLRERG